MQNVKRKLLLALGLIMTSSVVYSEVRTCTRSGNVEICEICEGNKCVVIVIELPEIPIEPIDPIDIGPPPKP